MFNIEEIFDAETQFTPFVRPKRTDDEDKEERNKTMKTKVVGSFNGKSMVYDHSKDGLDYVKLEGKGRPIAIQGLFRHIQDESELQIDEEALSECQKFSETERL